MTTGKLVQQEPLHEDKRASEVKLHAFYISAVHEGQRNIPAASHCG
jgi:hypothetical protein